MQEQKEVQKKLKAEEQAETKELETMKVDKHKPARLQTPCPP